MKNEGEVIGCVNSQGHSYSGGLIGYMNGGSIFDSSSGNTNVKGVRYVGGIVGATSLGVRFNRVNSLSRVQASENQMGGFAAYLFTPLVFPDHPMYDPKILAADSWWRQINAPGFGTLGQTYDGQTNLNIPGIEIR